MVRQNDQEFGDFGQGKKLPLRVETALAVMQMGVSDYTTIATSVGLTEQEVEQIDLSDDRRIRRLGIRGVSPEKQYRLLRPLRCPKCRGLTTVAPCLVCSWM
jgi:hypothetical protein